MLRTKLLTLAIATALTIPVAAQNCSDNLFPVQLVTAQGTALPYVQTGVEPHFTAADEGVYLAFPATIPSGTYYVFVAGSPSPSTLEMLSTNDPLDRFVSVQNVGGVISLSLPFASSPAADQFGIGLGGQGMSLRLSPFAASQAAPCRFKVLFGNTWDLTFGYDNPYLLLGGVQSDGSCAVRSYDAFWIGTGEGSDVTGSVFLDSDHDGQRDAGEGGFANQEVRLVTGTTSVATTTDAAGGFRFENVAAGSYTVEYTVPGTHVATTAASRSVEVCACADVAVADFGAAPMALPCNARTVGYWRNQHGLCKVQQFNLLPTLPMLQIVNTFGCRVAPGSLWQFRAYLMGANSWNMAYQLSAQLVAMHCNVAVGFVHPNCVIQDPCLGRMTVAQLMQQAVASLIQHRYTPPCTWARHQQEKLKNALDRANNNCIWR